MRFISCVHQGTTTLAVEVDGELLAVPGSTSLLELLEFGPAALAKAEKDAIACGERLSPSEIVYLPVIPRPGKIICAGLNYADHAKESDFSLPPYPVVFARFSTSLVGHDQPLLRPLISEQFDYEGELAVIIGKRGKHISKEDALNYVAGYAAFNEVSVRDFQFKSHQWTMGKNFDATGAFGPAFVSADELPAGAKGLRIVTKLNDEIVQDASTDDMIFDVADLISTISEVTTLEPGDVIVTGTPAGVGLARTPPLWMREGDRCSVSIERIGTVTNKVVDEIAA